MDTASASMLYPIRGPRWVREVWAFAVEAEAAKAIERAAPIPATRNTRMQSP
jgi:hypothetical protein